MTKRRAILIGVLAIALLGGLGWAGATFWPETGAQTASAQSRAATATTSAQSYTQDFTVRKGNLTASIAPVGEVYAPHQVSLSFNANGVAITELNVKAGQAVDAGAALAKIDTSVLQGNVDKALANMLSAEEALETAQESYTDVDKLQAEAAQIQAQTNLEAALEKLQDLLKPDVASAQQALADAQVSLTVAENKLTTFKADKTAQAQIETLQWQANEAEVSHGEAAGHASGANPSEAQVDYEWVMRNKMLDAQEALQRALIQAKIDLLSTEHNVDVAKDALQKAQTTLAERRAGSDEVTLAQAKNSVAQAEYDVAKANDDMETLLAGPDEKKIKLAQARYDSAKAAYDEAVSVLEGAAMVAPFAGTVVAVNASVGDLVSPNLAVITLADLSDLRVRASIDETEIANVAIGQKVAMTFDALPGKTLAGEVLEVPLDGTLANNVVTFAVDIALAKAGEDVTLKPGMTANLTITTGSKQNVLVVPAMAIARNSEGVFVTLREAAGSQATSQAPVQTGITNGTYTEITRGLNEGDIVVVTYTATTNQQQQFGMDMQGGGPMPGGEPPAGGAPPSGGGR